MHCSSNQVLSERLTTRRRRMVPVWLMLLFVAFPILHGDDILFFGNSFTSVGDVPKLVETIAASKGKTAAAMSVLKGGKDWGYHLQQPDTDVALKSKAWDWVVLQDFSLKATPAGSPTDFIKNGQAFYDRIVQESPHANIVLYETWAYAPQHPEFTGTAAAPAKLANPAEMYADIHKNYAALHDLLQARDATRKVLVAPVGTAFAQCIHDHPEINLYKTDFKHPDAEGSYLSALVIYATLFHDSPQGAAAAGLDPKEAQVLQDVAASVVQKG